MIKIIKKFYRILTLKYQITILKKMEINNKESYFNEINRYNFNLSKENEYEIKEIINDSEKNYKMLLKNTKNLLNNKQIELEQLINKGSKNDLSKNNNETKI